MLHSTSFQKITATFAIENYSLIVDNQALAHVRWIMALEKYHFSIEHRTKPQHRNADGASEKTKEYERQL